MDVRLAQLESFLGFNFHNKTALMGQSLKHKGLYLPEAQRTYGGAKVKQLFLLDKEDPNSVAVSIDYKDVTDNETIKEIEKIVRYYNEDGSVYCEKVELELVRNEDKLKRSRSQAAYDYLRNTAKGTPAEPYTNEILTHYAQQVNLWLLGNPQILIDAVNKETDENINHKLSIQPAIALGITKTVKEAIIEQASGVRWIPKT